VDDDLKLLKRLRADAPEPAGERLDALRARSLDRRRAPRRARGSWLAPSALVLATAAAAGIVVLNRVDQPPAPRIATTQVTTTPIGEPRVVLLRAASVAERREPAATPRDDQWLYRQAVVRQPGATERDTQEYWTRYDGGQQATRHNHGPLDLRTVEPDPDDDDLSPKQYAAKLAALPTDPVKLLAHVKGDAHWRTKPVREAGQEPPDARAFRVLTLYLGQPAAVTPELAAAIFRALARIPGVRIDQGVPDAMGRPGLGLAYDPGQRRADGRLVERSYTVLDPETFQYLGLRVENLEDDVIHGSLVAAKGTFYATAELTTGVVDKPGQLP
jgi:hypothetical protein